MAQRTTGRGWEPTIAWRALARTVIAVATTRREGTWKAYVAAVPGVRHEQEWQQVLRDGDALPECEARAIFPRFCSIPYAD